MTQNDALAICSFFGSSTSYGFDCGEHETGYARDKIIRDEDQSKYVIRDKVDFCCLNFRDHQYF